MPSSRETSEFGLREYGRVIWRHKFIVLLLGVLAAGASAGIDSRRTPIYQSTAQLLLLSPVSPAISALSDSPDTSTIDVPTEAKVIESPSTQTAVAADLRTPAVPSASVSEQGTTDVVAISVDSTDPDFAAQVANEYANVYINSTREATIQSLDSAKVQLNKRIASLGSQITRLQSEIDATPSASKSTSSNAVASLQAQELSLVDQQTTLQQQVASLQDEVTLTTGDGRLVGRALASFAPISPHKKRDAVLAGVLGLLVGIGLALLRTFLDDRIRSEEDARSALGEVPILGYVPMMRSWRKQRVPPLIAKSSPKSTTAEAFRKLRTAIQFAVLDEPVRTILVTSPMSSDGKTTLTANLANAMAEGGRRVVVLGCDLRNPLVQEHFGLSNDIGFTSVLLGDVRLADAIQDVPGVAGLRVLTAGPIPPNPSELLASARSRKVIRALATYADIVIVDTTPILPVADASILAAQVDAVVLVLSASFTKSSEASHAVDVLHQVKANVIGGVVNRVPEGESGVGYRYSYGYTYSYGPDQEQGSRRRRGHGGHHLHSSRNTAQEEQARRAVLAGGDDFDPEDLPSLKVHTTWDEPGTSAPPSNNGHDG